jgi:hypothetical protein
MPAEVIRDQVGPFLTRVGWGHEVGYVQVSTQFQTGLSGAKQITQVVSDWFVACGHPPLDFSLIEKLPLEVIPGIQQGPHFDGWTATLDRDDVNKLIRTLRRARDSAFGADA